LALRKVIVNHRTAKVEPKIPPDQRRLSPQEIDACYTELLQYCKQQGHPGIVLSMPHLAKIDKPIEIEYKAEIEKIAKDNQAIFVDAYHSFREHGYWKPYFLDAVHPTERGHQVLADMLRDAILQNHLIPP
ncbi:MAG TPA: SGNH/GDSL hydrolase family protein, partial [Candidatus Xenobia bacterium]